ncbi:tetratricopeptide repeat protein [Mesorhizobium sp. M1182]|uniref:tetratricopeptide repeat protein n=1 Tax=Mesorhizobium sp. M1182 TaxID=2957067 RepID=UPI00333ACF98
MQPAKARSRVATLHRGTLLSPSSASEPRICFERAERATGRHPENAAPLHRGALALAYFGERKKARSWLARALAIDPDDFVTQYNAACMYSVLGEVEEAVRYWKEPSEEARVRTYWNESVTKSISTPFSITAVRAAS